MMSLSAGSSCLFLFNGTATTEIYTYGHTLSLHDALPISIDLLREPEHCITQAMAVFEQVVAGHRRQSADAGPLPHLQRSEEHTSELQSLMRISYAVFCLKKKKHHQNL